MAIISGSYHSMPSKHIRLIRLSTNLDDPVSGHLEVVALHKAPPYYAISHAWAENETTERLERGYQIELCGSLSACITNLQRFSVRTSNLNPQLTYIWLDSISINQNDLDERSSQVAIMGKIYSRSIRTMVWLGQDSWASTYGAWDIVMKIYAVFQNQNPTAKVFSDIPIKNYDEQSHLALGLPPCHDVQWKCLARLMELRWFSRIWVVQEVVLSEKDPILLHGDYCYAWECLGWAATWLRRSGYMRLPWIPEPLRNVDTISDLRRTRTRWPLDALMSITQVKFNATDQRDKIYALLGLATMIPDELKPDYTIRTAILYRNAARLLLGKGSSLAILTRARCLEDTKTRGERLYNLQLPSWCPDWSDFRTYNQGISTSLSWIEYSDPHRPAKLDFPTGYSASGNLKLRLNNTERGPQNESILNLSGFRVEQVVHVQRLDIRQSDHGVTSNLDAAMAPILRLAFSLSTFHEMSTLVKSFIQTTTASQHSLIGTSGRQALADGEAWLQGFFQRNADMTELLVDKSGNKDAALHISREPINGDEENYAYLVRNYCFDRCFFITSAGRMGLGPSNALPDDTVTVIRGGGVPYLLRSLGDSWSLVGESYIHGLMGGEVIQAIEQGLILEEILSLR